MGRRRKRTLAFRANYVHFYCNWDRYCKWYEGSYVTVLRRGELVVVHETEEARKVYLNSLSLNESKSAYSYPEPMPRFKTRCPLPSRVPNFSV